MLQQSDLAFAVFLAVLTLVALPVTRTRQFQRLTTMFDRLAVRRSRAVAVCGSLSAMGSTLVARYIMSPEPRVHDEFSYLLAADTFAHGRLTNPTHPLWQHFESFHIFHQPTYASKYPPAQGALLALGKVLTGDAIVGAWIGGALMCAAICWMLYAYVSPRWALFGGLIATVQVGIATYWTQSYWGGAVPAAGGALVFGTAPRLVRDAKVRDAVILALGLLVLANSRPVDGAITCLAAAIYLALAFRRQPRRLAAAAVTVVGLLALGGAGMAAYNSVLTGHWWLHPYAHHESIYSAQPIFLLQDRQPEPEFRHEELKRLHTGVDEPSAAQPGSALDLWGARRIRNFFAGRALVVPWAAGTLVGVAQAEGLMLVGAVLLGTVALALLHFFQIHYIATITGPVFALIALGLERIHRIGRGRWRFGAAFCLAVLVPVAMSLRSQLHRVPLVHTSFGNDLFHAHHRATVASLLASPGKDVVIVSDGPLHSLHRDWVYNDADIDASEIVWARDMGAERNRELLDYYPDRKIWRLRDGFGAAIDGLSPYDD